MEFRCMWATEPVSECPPVKELDRLREENRRLKNEIQKMREDADKPAASQTTWVAAGEDEQRSERAFEPARKRDDTELVRTTNRLREDVKRLEQENRWLEELREENRELEESRKRIAARADDLEDSLFCK